MGERDGTKRKKTKELFFSPFFRLPPSRCFSVWLCRTQLPVMALQQPEPRGQPKKELLFQGGVRKLLHTDLAGNGDACSTMP